MELINSPQNRSVVRLPLIVPQQVEGRKNYRVTAGTVGLSTLPQIHRGSKAVGSVARSER